MKSAPTATRLADPTIRDVAERVIVPARRRVRPADVVRAWPVISVLASRDFKVKYKQSLLGPLWLVFQPLALLGAFFVAFRGLGSVETSGVPYVVFALIGLTVWSFFQAAMIIGTASIMTNAYLVRFTPCPRPAFPIAAILASLPSFGVTAAGAIVAAAVTGHLSPRIVLLPLMLVWLLVLTTGIVGITSAVAVPYRDVVSALPFLLQVGIFFAPIGYSLAELSDTVRALVSANPLSGVIEASRWAVISDYVPSVEPIVVSLALTPVVVAAGWRIFTRLETVMADVI